MCKVLCILLIREYSGGYRCRNLRILGVYNLFFVSNYKLIYL